MPSNKVNLTDQEFINAYQHHGPEWIAHQFDIVVRTVHSRRARLEKKLGSAIVAPGGSNAGGSRFDPPNPEKAVQKLDIKEGVVLVGSDGHYWPGVESTAHRALVEFASSLRPRAIIFNGDALDGATISRHPPIGWEHAPSLEDELAEVRVRLGEIAAAAPKACPLYWPLGNHDGRFNTRLASLTPEFRNVPGTRLVHHFPDWTPCWAVECGGRDGAVVKHRMRGGNYAPFNNTLWAGRTMVTGHLHSQKVLPLTDYNGTRWGVDTGCIAPAVAPQFLYQECNPSNHRSGFAVLTWWKGQLLPPELLTVIDEEKGLVVWRGEVSKV